MRDEGRKNLPQYRVSSFFAGDRIKRIDVYFGATYQDGLFVRQNEALSRNCPGPQITFEIIPLAPSVPQNRFVLSMSAGSLPALELTSNGA